MKELLQCITQKPVLEAKWLNTLSMLEFVGARKIGKTVCKDHPSLEILQHHADELRHAYLFKNLSLQLSQGKCVDYLCHDEALSYFQMLDHFLTEWLNEETEQTNPYHNYLLVTCAIEKRAMQIYPVYQKITSQRVVADSLQKIIADENHHRKTIEHKIKILLRQYHLKDFKKCDVMENDLFNMFEGAIQKEILVH